MFENHKAKTDIGQKNGIKGSPRFGFMSMLVLRQLFYSDICGKKFVILFDKGLIRFRQEF